jgi:hypothetical protein
LPPSTAPAGARRGMPLGREGGRGAWHSAPPCTGFGGLGVAAGAGGGRGGAQQQQVSGQNRSVVLGSAACGGGWKRERGRLFYFLSRPSRLQHPRPGRRLSPPLVRVSRSPFKFVSSTARVPWPFADGLAVPLSCAPRPCRRTAAAAPAAKRPHLAEAEARACRSSPASTTSSSTPRGPPPGSRPWPASGAANGRELAGEDHLHVYALWAAARQPASAGCGAAAGAELAGAEHFHLCALRAAARQPAWAGGGAAAGWELDGADHLCASRAAVRRLALAGCGGATPPIPPSHVTTAHPLTCSHSHIATPYVPTYSL